MGYKDPKIRKEKAKIYSKKHYENNKAIYIERSRLQKLALKTWLDEVKNKPCTDCGILYPPYVMDFDHTQQGTKLGNVADLVSKGSLTKLKEEISKCELVCANCHRIRTHNRKNAG